MSLLPDKYQQVEYIESTGTQYIDTDVKCLQTTIFEITNTFNTLSETQLFGAFANSKRAHYGINSGQIYMPTVTNGTTSEHIFSGDIQYHTYYLSTSQYKYDDTIIASGDFEFPINSNFFLFARNNEGTVGNYCKSRLKKAKIYNNNTLIRNFIPCYRKSDGEIGLYDTITNTFFTNTGTGIFNKGVDIYTTASKLSYLKNTVNQFEDKSIDLFGKDFIENATFRELANEYKNLWTNWPNKVAGEGASLILENTKKGKMQIQSIGNTTQKTSILPDEYQQVEYIEATGTQYIDTGVFTENTLKVECVCKFIEESGRNGSVYASNRGWVSWGTSSSGGLNALFCSGDRQGVTINYDNNFHKYILQNGLQKIDNIETNITTDTMPETLKIYLFAFSNDYSSTDIFAKEMIKYCKIYNNNDLIRDFIPCYRKSDGEIGLYDLVNNVFYTNNGTGTFNKGNDVSIPNPNYQQVIKNITGNNKVVVRGKNILSNNYNDYKFDGVYGYKKIIEIPKESRLVLSIEDKDTTIDLNGVYFGFTKNGKNADGGAYWIVTNGEPVQSKVISTIEYEYFSFYPNNQKTFEKIFNRYNIQIEIASQSVYVQTPYEPYIEPIEKNLNFGNYILMKGDYITEDCVIHHKRKQIDLSTINWHEYATNKYDTIIQDIQIPPNNFSTNDVFAEKYIKTPMANSFVNGNIGIGLEKRVAIYDQTGTPTGLFEYILQKEITETILENTTLYNQIKDLYRIIIPGGTIVIETENEEENAPLIISASALKNLSE